MAICGENNQHNLTISIGRNYCIIGCNAITARSFAPDDIRRHHDILFHFRGDGFWHGLVTIVAVEAIADRAVVHRRAEEQDLRERDIVHGQNQ